MSTKTFFITGATGQQGGHTARLLLAAGHKVQAIARDPSCDAAIQLQSLGATIFKGSFSDKDALLSAARGCDGVFLNVSPDFTDPHGERKFAQNIIDACQEAGVKKIVQSSIPVIDPEETVGDFDPIGFMKGYMGSKKACEEAVKSAPGFKSWTILRPARLLNTYIAPLANWMFPNLATHRIIKTAFKPDFKQQILDPLDVGRFATAALLDDTGKFHHATIPLANEELTIEEVAEAMNAELASFPSAPKVKIEFLTGEELEEAKGKNPLIASEIFVGLGKLAFDLEEPRRYGIQMSSTAAFFKREKAALAKAVGL